MIASAFAWLRCVEKRKGDSRSRIGEFASPCLVAWHTKYFLDGTRGGVHVEVINLGTFVALAMLVQVI